MALSALFIGVVCLIAMAVLFGAIMIVVTSKHGQGVSDARENWISGHSSNDDE